LEADTVAYIAAVKFGEEQMPKYYLTGDIEVRPGDFCVVTRGKLEAVGLVGAVEGHPCRSAQECPHYPPILRLATEKEIARWHKTRKRERDAMVVCKRKVAEHGLPMKVSTVEIDEHHNKIIFHFTADKRVDFRALVRDLAGTLRARIELWQIGVRDEAKILDGYGVCGQRLCCAGYFREFKPISIRMAKNQDIALAPSKLSGCCGRLMCCLAFEEPAYLEMAERVPPVGALIRTDDLEAIVVDRNILTQKVQVMDRNEKLHNVPIEAINQVVEVRDRKGRKIKRWQDLEQEAETTETELNILPADDEDSAAES
jgi:cell fate regulator YaaT (PSP1 superfamily)